MKSLALGLVVLSILLGAGHRARADEPFGPWSVDARHPVPVDNTAARPGVGDRGSRPSAIDVDRRERDEQLDPR